jgi:hypothetical protein
MVNWNGGTSWEYIFGQVRKFADKSEGSHRMDVWRVDNQLQDRWLGERMRQLRLERVWKSGRREARPDPWEGAAEAGYMENVAVGCVASGRNKSTIR